MRDVARDFQEKANLYSNDNNFLRHLRDCNSESPFKKFYAL